MIVLDTNIENNATTQYDLDIDSMVRVDQELFYASSDGLYKLNDTSSETFSAYFELNSMNFNTYVLKRLRYVYLSYESVGEVTLSISTEQGVSDSYVFPSTDGTTKNYHMPISRKLYGKYFTLHFAGNNFAINQIDILPIYKQSSH